MSLSIGLVPFATRYKLDLCKFRKYAYLCFANHFFGRLLPMTLSYAQIYLVSFLFYKL